MWEIQWVAMMAVPSADWMVVRWAGVKVDQMVVHSVMKLAAVTAVLRAD